MSLTADELHDIYSRKTNADLVDLATRGAADLTPTALTVLQRVMKERDIDESVFRSMEVQTQPIDEAALLRYTELLRSQACPLCGSTSKKLNACLSGTVISYVVMTNYDKQLHLACPDCLDRKNDQASSKSASLGWWGFPWGIIRTAQALSFNSSSKQHNHDAAPSDVLKLFVLQNLGRIEAVKDNPKQLQQLVADAN